MRVCRDDSVAEFVSAFRKVSIWREMPSEVEHITVKQTLSHSKNS